jgi:AraC-like DNA-binding protein
VSYDQGLLYKRISQSLHRNASSSLGKLSRELRVGQRTIEKAIIAASGKTFRELREEIMLECVRSTLTSDPTRAIKGLASDLGYKSPRSFARAIKRACGSSPEELRSRIIRDLATAENTTVLG